MSTLDELVRQGGRDPLKEIEEKYEQTLEKIAEIKEKQVKKFLKEEIMPISLAEIIIDIYFGKPFKAIKLTVKGVKYYLKYNELKNVLIYSFWRRNLDLFDELDYVAPFFDKKELEKYKEYLDIIIKVLTYIVNERQRKIIKLFDALAEGNYHRLRRILGADIIWDEEKEFIESKIRYYKERSKLIKELLKYEKNKNDNLFPNTNYFSFSYRIP